MVIRKSFAAAAVLIATAACGDSTPQPTTPNTSTVAKPAAAANEVKSESVKPSTEAQAIVDAADRDADDKKLDAGRKPAETLTYYGVKPGMKVADLASGGGYTTELLVRAVGPTGVVYAQNNPFIVEKFADKVWTARLAKPINKNAVRVVREFDDPLPPEAKDLDLVIMSLFYHDTFWMKTDRAKMNAAILKALKPGGIYAITDHSGKAGTGATEVSTLHRIEESVVREEITKAGFKLASEADFLRNKADPRDWNASPMSAAEKRGTSDRFVLKFVKP